MSRQSGLDAFVFESFESADSQVVHVFMQSAMRRKDSSNDVSTRGAPNKHFLARTVHLTNVWCQRGAFGGAVFCPKTNAQLEHKTHHLHWSRQHTHVEASASEHAKDLGVDRFPLVRIGSLT